jgi:hypothetical protein
MGELVPQNLGSGVVEIAALTALVGTSTVESLTLGDRGAAGLPWAAISSFGVISLIQACVAASTPASLRDTMGVRGERADLAVGLYLPFHTENKRRTHGKVKGVTVHLERVRIVYLNLSFSHKTHSTPLGIYQPSGRPPDSRPSGRQHNLFKTRRGPNLRQFQPCPATAMSTSIKGTSN